MISKNPLDIISGKRLTREEVAQSIRLAIIAELDAINLYLQLANAIDDPDVKKVFIDIAEEENVHVGEFLEILKKCDESLIETLKKGSREVRELLGK